jgi:hypothetical protein
VKKALDGTKLGMRIVEDFKPRELPPDARVTRSCSAPRSGVKSADSDTIKAMTVSSGRRGRPRALRVCSQFAMYRVAPL